jgi:S-adenosylmethionine-diacylglycerol 3-amino-3-carboxypropyl transferase
MSAIAAELLRETVQHHRPASLAGIQELVFRAWFKGFVYNQIWEDPRVDAAALALSADSRVLTICSGGCNVLSYLIHRPAAVTALDVNVHHLHLTRLKLTAAKHVEDHEAFYRMFGVGAGQENLKVYDQEVRRNVPSDTLRYWEGRRWVGKRPGARRIEVLARGLYNSGRLGGYLKGLQGLHRTLFPDPRIMLESGSLEEQAFYFDRLVAPAFDLGMIRWAVRHILFGFNLGIPPRQHKALLEEAMGDLVGLFRSRVRRLLCAFPIRSNYFAWQALARSYDHVRREAIPDYLRREHFDAVRSHAHRVQTHNVSLNGYLKYQPDGALDAFALLDAQDWMPPERITELWTHILRVGGRGARVVFRTAGTRSPLESALPYAIRRRLIYHSQTSSALHAQDRSGIYGMLHLYEVG